MVSYLTFILIGLTSGSAYALVAVGLVLTYRTSGVFNFAHGAIAMVAAYAYYSFSYGAHLPTALSIALAVLLVGPIAGVVLDRLVFRRLMSSTTTAQVVATVGLLVLLQTLAVIIYGGNTIQISQFLPSETVRVGSLNIGWDQIIVVVVAIVATLLLRLFYEHTLLGLNTRGLVDNDDLAQMEGVHTRRLTGVSWALGAAFAGMAGVILVPTIGLDSTGLTLLVLQAFGAAVIGRLVSLPWAYAGALIIGVGSALATKWAATISTLQGLPTSLPFIVLFLVIIFRKRSRPLLELRLPSFVRRPTHVKDKRLRYVVWLGWLAVLVLVPALMGTNVLLAASATAGYVIIMSSLYALTGLSRQVSLCQGVFASIGAIMLVHCQEWHIPFGAGLLLAGLASVPVAAFVAIPAIRVNNLYLALATFGFGILAEDLVWTTRLGFGAEGQISVLRPIGFGGQRAYYWLMLAIALATVLVVGLLVRSRLGRYIRALADSEIGVESLGVRPALARVMVFCLSGFLAAIGGALLGGLYQSVTSTEFNYQQSLLFVTVLVTAGMVGQSGVVFGAVLFAAVPTLFTWDWLSNWSGVFFGLNAIIYASTPEGMMGPIRAAWSKLGMLIRPAVTAKERSTSDTAAPLDTTRAHHASPSVES